MSITPLKSDYCVALEQCVTDGQQLITAFKENVEMDKCVALTKDCIEFCIECLHDYESARLDRGKMIQSCINSCIACSVECDKYDFEICKKFTYSCRKCVEELQLILA